LKRNRHKYKPHKQYQIKISREWVSVRDQNPTAENINTEIIKIILIKRKSVKLIANHRNHHWRPAKMEDGGGEQLAWRRAYQSSAPAVHALARVVHASACEDQTVKQLTMDGRGESRESDGAEHMMKRPPKISRSDL
jgi:hypothetical protein